MGEFYQFYFFSKQLKSPFIAPVKHKSSSSSVDDALLLARPKFPIHKSVWVSYLPK